MSCGVKTSSSDKPGGNSDSDDKEQEESEVEDITGIYKIYQYLKNASKIAGAESALDSTFPPLAYKKKQPQQDLHTCLVCNKTISHPNKASRKRHANSNHNNDRNYDYEKAIVPIDHQAVVGGKRKKKRIFILVNIH